MPCALKLSRSPTAAAAAVLRSRYIKSKSFTHSNPVTDPYLFQVLQKVVGSESDLYPAAFDELLIFISNIHLWSDS